MCIRDRSCSTYHCFYRPECWGEDQIEYYYSYHEKSNVGSIGYINAAHTVECGKKCAENPYCRFWTYYAYEDVGSQLGKCNFYWTDVGLHKRKNIKANSGKQLCLGIHVFGDEHNKLVKEMAYHTRWLNKGQVRDDKESVARIVNAIPCHSLFCGHYDSKLCPPTE